MKQILFVIAFGAGTLFLLPNDGANKEMSNFHNAVESHDIDGVYNAVIYEYAEIEAVQDTVVSGEGVRSTSKYLIKH